MRSVADALVKSRAGILYPRGATLGGSSQVNAMNFAWAPDNEWDYIADLTGDESWGHENMRRYLTELENCTYVPRGTPGHGFDGYLEVRKLSTALKLVADASRNTVQPDGSNDNSRHYI